MGGGAAPCGACKFLRRKCVKGCIFAPYFCSEELGAAHFGAIHKVFGASNFSKLLMHIPVEDRYDAVVSVSYEAQARLHDPIYGCVSHIFALQHQVASLQAKLNVAHAQLATSSLDAGPGTVSGSYGTGGGGGGGGPGPRQQRSDISCSSSTSGSPYDQQRHFFPSQSMYGGTSASVAGGCENMEEGSSLPMDYSHSHSSSTSTSTTDLFGQEPMADEGDLQAFALALLRRKH